MFVNNIHEHQLTDMLLCRSTTTCRWYFPFRKV